MADHPATYPPLDVPKPVAENVWIVDSGPLRAMGMPLPVRMTVIRLPSGALLLHSPTRFRGSLKRQLEKLGSIRHLVAPNSAHWSFLKEWQQNCPDIVSWAVPGLRERGQVKRSGAVIDHDLTEMAPPEWAGEIEQVVVPGGGGFREMAFFHKSSWTLVLTDLIVNIEPEKLPRLMRLGGRLAGATAPEGKAPIYLRLVIRMKRDEARKAASRLVSLEPERVIFAHGSWFERDAAARLRKSLSWLLR